MAGDHDLAETTGDHCKNDDLKETLPSSSCQVAVAVEPV